MHLPSSKLCDKQIVYQIYELLPPLNCTCAMPSRPQCGLIGTNLVFLMVNWNKDVRNWGSNRSQLTGIEAFLLLVVVDNGGAEPTVLSVPHLLLEAAQSPSDQNKARTRARTPLAAPVDAVKRNASVNRVREVKGSADARPINRNSCEIKKRNHKTKQEKGKLDRNRVRARV